MGERKASYRILVRKYETRKRPRVKPCEDGSVIFKLIFKKYDGLA
jgi:hypothetical protein